MRANKIMNYESILQVGPEVRFAGLWGFLRLPCAAMLEERK